ncbi:hypothetical protein HanPI659440_Chr06g0221631 [Helianthus annuus]|nr:hypothetical protein HanPI659440_Chr06g0221631 [Helianthus annuus]KAJ0913914.1 hypothetical protein HanPSC8_Chr06g0232661 [Helianthus annuus]
MLHCKLENLVLSNQRFYSTDEQVDYIDTLSVVVPVDAITTFVSKTDMQERSRLQEKHYSAFKGVIQKLQVQSNTIC